MNDFGSSHAYLVDGSAFIYRAYHAYPPLSRKRDGLQINAVFGFCNMLWKLLRDMEEQPTHLAVIFDRPGKNFRHELYTAYKGNRAPLPHDLAPQFPLIREAVRAFNLACVEQQGFEADDIIATYVRAANDRNIDTTIVSADKDLMQLVNGRVVMYDTMHNRRIGIAEVIEKFGVPPSQMIDLQALVGDTTDNVPGVPSIGVKTAAALLLEFGDLETLLARASEVKKPKCRQSLIDSADVARLSKRLVTLDIRVPVEVPFARLQVQPPDKQKLLAFLDDMEFATLARQVEERA